MKLPSDSPAARAAARLQVLIEACGNPEPGGSGFDPWAMAEFKVQVEHHKAEYRNEDAAIRERAATLWTALSEAQERYTGPLLRSPEAMELAADECLRLRPQIEEGDGSAVMAAVASCAAHGLAMPGWLAAAFVVRQQRVIHGTCRSWDEAFGPPFAKGENLAGYRSRRLYGPWAHLVACQLLAQDPQRAIDRGLYEEIGEVIGRSHSQVFEHIREYLADPIAEPAPLEYVRNGLASGQSTDEVLGAWRTKTFNEFCEKLGLQALDP